MNPARIAELLEPFIRARPSSVAQSKFDCHSEPAKAGEEAAGLCPTQLHHISTYIDILIRWNARINLTAIRKPEQIVTGTIRNFGFELGVFEGQDAVQRDGKYLPLTADVAREQLQKLDRGAP